MGLPLAPAPCSVLPNSPGVAHLERCQQSDEHGRGHIRDDDNSIVSKDPVRQPGSHAASHHDEVTPREVRRGPGPPRLPDLRQPGTCRQRGRHQANNGRHADPSHSLLYPNAWKINLEGDARVVGPLFSD